MAKATPATLNAVQIRLVTVKKDTKLHRVHDLKYGGAAFNSSGKGDTRFSPLFEGGIAVPTMYAGENLDCALMETIFHDVPFTNGPRRVRRSKIDSRAYSVLTTQVDIQLADLTSIALRRMGISRTDIIETTAKKYPRTREWAIAIRKASPSAQGFMWTSRQHDRQEAYVLFGDRLGDGAGKHVVAVQTTERLESKISEVSDLAERLGVDLC